MIVTIKAKKHYKLIMNMNPISAQDGPR